MLPYVYFPFLRWVKFCSDCYRQVFFIWETKNVVAGFVRQVLVLYSNDCMEIWMGGLSIGRLIEVVVCLGLTVYTLYIKDNIRNLL